MIFKLILVIQIDGWAISLSLMKLLSRWMSPHFTDVNIGSGNGLAPSDTKLLS